MFTNMAANVSVVKLIFGIVALIVTVQVLTMLHFSSLHMSQEEKYLKSKRDNFFEDPVRDQNQRDIQHVGLDNAIGLLVCIFIEVLYLSKHL